MKSEISPHDQFFSTYIEVIEVTNMRYAFNQPYDHNHQDIQEFNFLIWKYIKTEVVFLTLRPVTIL